MAPFFKRICEQEASITDAIREIEEKDYLRVAAIWRNVLDIPTATDKVTKTVPAVRDFL